MPTVHDIYEKDYYLWLRQNAQLLRKGHFSDIDAERLAEELDSMGRGERRALVSRLSVVLAHLLTWLGQPARRSHSWQYTIEEQRRAVTDLLEESPSLRHELEDRLARAYATALLRAARQTGMAKTQFPEHCPFSLAQILDEDFWPTEI